MCVNVQGPPVKNGVDIWTCVRETRHALFTAVHGSHYDTEYLVEEGISVVYLGPPRIS